MNLAQNFDTTNVKTNQFGYQIENEQQVINAALLTGFNLVKTIRTNGAKTRNWILTTNLELKRIIYSNEGTLDVGLWENRVMEVLRQYMGITSEILNDLKQLNPPISTSQLKPFRDAMSLDRKITIDTFDPLMKTLAEAAELMKEKEPKSSPASRQPSESN